MSTKAKDDQVQLRYIQWDEAFNAIKPYELFAYSLPNLPRQNFKIKPEPKETMHDIRGHEKQFSLQEHGFSVRRHVLELASFDEVTVENQYFPQIKKLIQEEVEDVDEIFFFNWGVCLHHSLVCACRLSKIYSFGRQRVQRKKIPLILRSQDVLSSKFTLVRSFFSTISVFFEAQVSNQIPARYQLG